MNATEVRAELAELREASAALRARPLADIHAELARVFDQWSRPESLLREQLVASLPSATGLHPETIREGLARGLNAWTGSAFKEATVRELGGSRNSLRGFETTAVLLGGEIPMPTLLSVLAPLAVGSPVLAKAGSRDPITAAQVVRSIAQVAPSLAPFAKALPPLSDPEAQFALLDAECIVAAGSDATIAKIKQRLRPDQRFIPAGHRFSLGALGDQVLGGEALQQAAENLALDIALWDQQGCLSPIACYVAANACDAFSEALAEALTNAEKSWPRGRITPSAAAVFHHERIDAEMRSANTQGMRLFADTESRWTVVRETDRKMRRAPLHRFVRVHPLPDADALVATLRPNASHLAGIALAGFGEQEQGLAESLSALGATRICAPGTLQTPPLAWRHEGRDLFTPLARSSR